MPGILWSQQEKLAAAVGALSQWTTAATKAGVRVNQLNITLLDPDDPQKNSDVIFDWDEAAGEYSMRTV